MTEQETTSPDDERAEWERARAGDREALEALLRRHEQGIFRFARRMCGDDDAAGEVLQRTMLVAFENLGSFRGDARLSTWLYALARSQCARLRRRTRSAPAHDVALDAQGAPSLASEAEAPEAATRREELAQMVGAAIALLPTLQREAVVLKDVEDLPLDEAARASGLAVPAFKSRLHRAREKLRSTLATLLRDAPAERLSCPALAATLHSFDGQALNRRACHTIELHVESCPTCRDRLGHLQEAAALCRSLPGDEVPEPVRRAVRTALTAVQRG